MASVDELRGYPVAEPAPDLYQLLERLQELAERSRRLPFGNSLMIDEHELLELVESLRQAFPREIRQARRILQERQQIITEAQLEAQRILATAQERAQYLMSEQGIMNETRARCEEMLRQAMERKQRIMSETDEYVRQMLERIEAAAMSTLQHVQRVKTELKR